jgi:serine/threonine protein kinase
VVALREAVDCEEQDRLFLVMELVAGGQLMYWDAAARRYVRKGAPSPLFSEDEARRAFRELCQAMRYVHASRIAHRDLKPENILMTREGACKVADFGVAGIFEAGVDARGTEGTYGFMAPECLTGEPFDPFPTDVWAMGVCLYVMIYGRLPFYSDLPAELTEMIRTGAIEYPDEPTVSENLRDLLRRLLCRDVSARISIDDAIAHPWLGDVAAQPVAPVEVTEEEVRSAIRPNPMSLVRRARALSSRAPTQRADALAADTRVRAPHQVFQAGPQESAAEDCRETASLRARGRYAVGGG